MHMLLFLCHMRNPDCLGKDGRTHETRKVMKDLVPRTAIFMGDYDNLFFHKTNCSSFTLFFYDTRSNLNGLGCRHCPHSGINDKTKGRERDSNKLSGTDSSIIK